MPQMTFSTNVSGGGLALNGSAIRTQDNVNRYAIDLPAGKPGELTTRTNNTQGVITLESGHGLVTGQTSDIYWDTGRRIGVSITIATNACTITGGSGDNLPSTSEEMVVTPQVEFNVAIDGENLAGYAHKLQIPDSQSVAAGHVSYYNDDPVEVVDFELVANEVVPIDVEGGASNPFAATDPVVVSGIASNGDSANDAQLLIVVAQDATP